MCRVRAPGWVPTVGMLCDEGGALPQTVFDGVLSLLVLPVTATLRQVRSCEFAVLVRRPRCSLLCNKKMISFHLQHCTCWRIRCGGPSFDDFIRQAFDDEEFDALTWEDKASKGHLYDLVRSLFSL